MAKVTDVHVRRLFRLLGQGQALRACFEAQARRAQQETLSYEPGPPRSGCQGAEAQKLRVNLRDQPRRLLQPVYCRSKESIQRISSWSVTASIY